MNQFVFVIFMLPTLAFAQLPHFYQVRPSDGSIPTKLVFRGGEPTTDGIKNLPGFGIRHLLNLESSDATFSLERSLAADLGMTVEQIKLSPLFLKPSPNKINKIIAFLSQNANYPLFIHCRYGEDRTGLVVALYRVFVESVDPRVAYQEMLAYGFHPISQAGIKCAFWERTGMPVPAYCGAIPLDQ